MPQLPGKYAYEFLCTTEQKSSEFIFEFSFTRTKRIVREKNIYMNREENFAIKFGSLGSTTIGIYINVSLK